MSDIPPLPPPDFHHWPKTADVEEEISVAFEVIGSALVAMAYDLRQIRLKLAESPLVLGESPKEPTMHAKRCDALVRSTKAS